MWVGALLHEQRRFALCRCVMIDTYTRSLTCTLTHCSLIILFFTPTGFLAAAQVNQTNSSITITAVITRSSVTAADRSRKCASLHLEPCAIQTTSHLAVVLSALKTANVGMAWIGLSRSSSTSSWIWGDLSVANTTGIPGLALPPSGLVGAVTSNSTLVAPALLDSLPVCCMHRYCSNDDDFLSVSSSGARCVRLSTCNASIQYEKAMTRSLTSDRVCAS
jgi:hypothetical protein